MSSERRVRASRQDRGVALERAGRCGDVLARGQHDLIDREPILPRLDSNRVRAARREADEGTHDADAPAVVLPAPSFHTAAGALLEVHLGGGCGTDAPGRRAARTD